MRKASLAAGFIGLILASTSAVAVDPLANRPEAKAYLTLNFGGAQRTVSNLRYGLRVDHDQRFIEGKAPAIFQMDFASHGFNHASINGLPFARTALQMNQDGDDVRYSIIDWGILALGVAGVGFIIAEVADGEDDPDNPPAQ